VACESERVEVVVTVTGTDIATHADQPLLEAWPVPADELLMIMLPDGLEPSVVELLDLSGRAVISHNIKGRTGRIDLDVAILAPGEYVIRLVHAEGVAIRPVMVQR
jgi:hypothetical protein